MAIPPKVKINLRMTEALRDLLEQMADQEQVSVNALLVRSVEHYLQTLERPATARKAAPRGAGVASPKGDQVPPPAGGVYAACPCGSGKKYRFCHGGKAK